MALPKEIASYIRTTKSSQLGKTAKQLDEEEKSFYERTKNLPKHIQALARADFDKANNNIAAQKAATARAKVGAAIAKANTDGKAQRKAERQQTQALENAVKFGGMPAEAAAKIRASNVATAGTMVGAAVAKADADGKVQREAERQQDIAFKNLANSGNVPKEAIAAIGKSLDKIAANNALQRETKRQQLLSLENLVNTGTISSDIVAKIAPNITGEQVKSIDSSEQEIKDYVNSTSIPDYAKSDVIKSMVGSGSNVDRLNPNYIIPSYDSKDLQLFMKLHNMPRDKAERYLNNLSPSELISVLNEQKERKDILEEAYDYFLYTWIPTENLKGWKGNITYKAGDIQRGMPYSQSKRLSIDGFTESMEEEDFYKNDFKKLVDDVMVQMPKYGTDCSAFVSDVLDLERLGTWGLYNEIKGFEHENVKSEDVLYELDSMYDLKPGDVILDAGNHVRLVEEVIGDRVFCIEQTAKGTFGTQRYSYNISDLDGYIPISKVDPNE